MNGATAELWVKISNNPNSTKTTTIGMSHHNFLCQRKCKSSPKIPNLDMKLLIVLILTFFRE
jgi:hypothetical protein